MRIKAYNLSTGKTEIFDKQNDAIEFSGLSKSTFISKIKCGEMVNDGWRFEPMPLSDEEVKRIERKLLKLKSAKKEECAQGGIKETDREKYTICHYETNGARVCITPCPHYLAPKPKIGSAKCQNCSYFHGIDRTSQEVACGRNGESSYRRRPYYRI